MIEALINGERDPGVLAELARGRMRRKIPDLRLACAGRFGAQHALMCTLHLEHIDHLTDMIARLDTRIDEASLPFVRQTTSSCEPSFGQSCPHEPQQETPPRPGEGALSCSQAISA
jgi:hypothetical protein